MANLAADSIVIQSMYLDFLGVRNTYFDIYLMINDQGNPKSHPENPLIWLLKNKTLPKTPKKYLIDSNSSKWGDICSNNSTHL